MANAVFWIIVGEILMVTGCAINDRGLVSARYFENESSYLLTQEAWGGYLSTRPTDGGLTIGHTKRLLLYAKPGNKSARSIDELLPQSTGYTFDKEIEEKDVDLKNVQPYAWIEKNQGVMFHANSMKIGVSGGVESSNVIRLPADFDGIFMFSYRDDGTVEAIIRKAPISK